MRRLALSVFSHRFLAIARLELHFIALRLKNILRGQRQAIRALLRSMPDPKYLNLGSGPRGLLDAHWMNIDGFPGHNVHFQLDFGRGLPFEDASFDGVFCEHVLEHFSLEDGVVLSREVRRVLKPGGVFRVVVPDSENVVRSYLDSPGALVSYRLGDGSSATPMEVVNLFFRQRYEHQFLYDWDTMRKMLTNAGFQHIERGATGCPQLSPALVLDDPKYAWESLYVEAQKRRDATSQS